MRLDVESTYTMRNTQPDRRIDGGVRFYFFTGLTVPIDDSSSELAVDVDGRPARFEIQDESGYDLVQVEFANRLDYGETFTISVRYRLAGERPRDPDSWVRVNPAYVSFTAVTFADPGLAEVTIQTPQDWVVDYTGDDLNRQTFGDAALYTASAIDDPLAFWVLFTARNDDGLASVPITLDDAGFELRAWPGDSSWSEFATRAVTDGVPELERLIGSEWPERGRNETDVIETSTPYLRGYAGFYYAETDVIEIGEDLDMHTMLHELSHAWFNSDHIETRWISEGLADEIGARATAGLGERLPLPNEYEPPLDADGQRLVVDTFPLNSWSRPLEALDDTTEYYGYRTAFLVMRTLRTEIGEAATTALLTAVLDDERAYPGSADADGRDGTGDGGVDWRDFLDLAEQVGGSTELVDQYRRYVVTGSQDDLLDDRAAALERYTGLVEQAAPWQPPEAVRAAMASWTFMTAGSAIDASVAALERRDLLIETLTPIGLHPTEALGVTFESSDDVALASEAIDAELGTARSLVEHSRALATSLDPIGQRLPPLEQSAYEESPDVLATAIGHLATRAAALAANETAVSQAVESTGLTVPALADDAFAAEPDAAVALSARRLAAADDVVAAHARLDASQSLLERVGGLGADADQTLERADAALAAGEYEAASDAARQAGDTVAQFDEAGAQRLWWSAAGMAAALVLLAAFRWRGRMRG